MHVFLFCHYFNTFAEGGIIPLIGAASNGHLDVVKELLDRGGGDNENKVIRCLY